MSDDPTLEEEDDAEEEEEDDAEEEEEDDAEEEEEDDAEEEEEDDAEEEEEDDAEEEEEEDDAEEEEEDGKMDRESGSGGVVSATPGTPDRRERLADAAAEVLVGVIKAADNVAAASDVGIGTDAECADGGVGAAGVVEGMEEERRRCAGGGGGRGCPSAHALIHAIQCIMLSLEGAASVRMPAPGWPGWCIWNANGREEEGSGVATQPMICVTLYGREIACDIDCGNS